MENIVIMDSLLQLSSSSIAMLVLLEHFILEGIDLN